MKNTLILLLLVTLTFTSLAQQEKPHFCTRDTSEHKEKNFAYDGFFNVDVSSGGNYYENVQYNFMIPNDSLKNAFGVILEVELTEPQNGVYEKMGSIYCSELHAPSNKKDVLNKGLYNDTWAFKKHIEIWYNGEYIKLIFPKLINRNSESFKHSFYVKKECYQDMLKAFKPNK